MTEVNREPWVAQEADVAASGRSLSLEDQLELVDRVKSLEARVAQLTSSRHLSPTEQLDAQQQVLELRRSLPWRVGRVVTVPVRVAERVTAGLLRRFRRARR